MNEGNIVRISDSAEKNNVCNVGTATKNDIASHNENVANNNISDISSSEDSNEDSVWKAKFHIDSAKKSFPPAHKEGLDLEPLKEVLDVNKSLINKDVKDGLGCLAPLADVQKDQKVPDTPNISPVQETLKDYLDCDIETGVTLSPSYHVPSVVEKFFLTPTKCTDPSPLHLSSIPKHAYVVPSLSPVVPRRDIYVRNTFKDDNQSSVVVFPAKAVSTRLQVTHFQHVFHDPLPVAWCCNHTPQPCVDAIHCLPPPDDSLCVDTVLNEYHPPLPDSACVGLPVAACYFPNYGSGMTAPAPIKEDKVDMFYDKCTLSEELPEENIVTGRSELKRFFLTVEEDTPGY